MAKRNYWQKRIEQEMRYQQKLDTQFGEQMRQLYEYHMQQIEREIHYFLATYGDKTGVPVAEVKKLVSEMDVKAFEDKAKRYVAMRDFSQQANKELALYNLTMKVNRLELLQYHLDLELRTLSEEEHRMTERFLRENFEREVTLQAGILGEVVASPVVIKHMSNALINTPYQGATWSKRIWKRQEVLRDLVQEMAHTTLIRGRNATTLIPQIRKQFNVSAYEAKRLAVTETARIQTAVQKEMYHQNGFGAYVYLAEPSACKTCAELHNKVFSVDNMQPGKNAAPMHPHCHCSTAPKVESLVITEKILNKNRANTLHRRGSIKGEFSNYAIPLKKSSVRSIAKKYNIDLRSIKKLVIARDKELIGAGFFGSAPVDKVGDIFLYPDSFKDEETLIRTLLHEMEHLRQYSEYGVDKVISDPVRFEKMARDAEENWNKFR